MKICKYNKNSKCKNIHNRVLGIFHPKCHSDGCCLIEFKNEQACQIKVGEQDILVFYTENTLSNYEYERLKEEISKYFPEQDKNKKILLLDGGLKITSINFKENK